MQYEKLTQAEIEAIHEDFAYTPVHELIDCIIKYTPECIVREWLEQIKLEQLAVANQ